MSETTCIPMVCAHCRRPILGSAVMTNGGGLFYHPECSQSWSMGWPPAPIDYDRIRQIVREEIVRKPK
jgi:hypothetical protein